MSILNICFFCFLDYILRYKYESFISNEIKLTMQNTFLPVELSLTVADLMLILSVNAGAAAANSWGSESAVDSSMGSGDTERRTISSG